MIIFEKCKHCFTQKGDMFNERFCDRKEWKKRGATTYTRLEISGCNCIRTFPIIWFINWFILRPISYIKWKIKRGKIK